MRTMSWLVAALAVPLALAGGVGHADQTSFHKIGELSVSIIGDARASAAPSSDEAAEATRWRSSATLRVRVVVVEGATRGLQVADSWVTAIAGGQAASERVDSTGRTVFFDVAPGPVRLVTGSPPDLGFWSGTLLPGEDRDVTLAVGGRQWLPLALGPELVVLPDGSLAGRHDDACAPLCMASTSVSGVPLAWHTTARVVETASWRETRLGPAPTAHLSVERHVLEPGDGRFVRIVDLVTNPTARPATVSYELHLGFSGLVRDVLLSSDSFIHLRAAAARARDSVLILGDGDAELPAVAIDPGEGVLWTTTRWPDLAIGPGATVGIVHFVVRAAQREPLMAWADPGAFDGLTERELVILANVHPPRHAMAILR